nr:YegP family protein [uncultured Macellibacteroides sp.]
MKATNGQVIEGSQLYASETTCKNGIESRKEKRSNNSRRR